jgi:putative tryptophan/tyrosine transport system substrate-binding protein
LRVAVGWRRIAAVARREALTAVAVVVLIVPLLVHAQSPRVRHVGLFHVGLDHDPPGLAPLRASLQRLGYEEGKTIRLDYRNQADEAAARETARAFVRERVDVIVAFENQAVRAAQVATSEIPIVFAHVSDPVAAGFVKSIARPGGNLTGVADYVGELQDKRMQILGQMVRLRRLLVLTDPTDPATPALMADVVRAAAQLSVQLLERRASTEGELAKIFASLRPGDVDAVIAVSPKLVTNFPALILKLSLERRIPLAYHRRALVEHGALFSYGPNMSAVGEDAAGYVDRILRGARPAELPVQQAARLELVINAKTAKDLGLTIPQSLRLQADGVIE